MSKVTTNYKTSGTMSFGRMNKVETFSRNTKHHVWEKPNTAHNHLISSIKHSGEGSFDFTVKKSRFCNVPVRTIAQPD